MNEWALVLDTLPKRFHRLFHLSALRPACLHHDRPQVVLESVFAQGLLVFRLRDGAGRLVTWEFGCGGSEVGGLILAFRATGKDMLGTVALEALALVAELLSLSSTKLEERLRTSVVGTGLGWLVGAARAIAGARASSRSVRAARVVALGVSIDTGKTSIQGVTASDEVLQTFDVIAIVHLGTVAGVQLVEYLLNLSCFRQGNVGHLFFILRKEVHEALTWALLEVAELRPSAGGTVAVAVPVTELIEAFVGGLEDQSVVEVGDGSARNANLKSLED